MDIIILIIFRIIAAIHAHDFIDQRPHPMTRSSNARITTIPPIIHPKNGIRRATDPAKRENKPPIICNNANIVTPKGLSPVGAEYPDVGVGISAIFLHSRVKGAGFTNITEIYISHEFVTRLLQNIISERFLIQYP